MPSPEQLLSKPQRNDLFRALEKSGALVSEFSLQVHVLNPRQLFVYHDSSQSSFLIHNAGSAFQIGGSLGNGDPSMREDAKMDRFSETVGISKVMGRSPSPSVLTWEQVVPLVEKWALAAVEGFREYEEIPDLWEEFERSRHLIAAPSENTLFTEAERQQVSVHIQQIKAYITTTYELSADRLSEVNERLDQIEEASRRLGRKDWLMAFSGAVFSLLLSDLIPPQAAQHILTLTLHGLGHLFGLGGSPMPLP